MIQKLIGLSLAFLLLCNENLIAQKIQVSYLGGRIKKHKEELFYTTPPYSQGGEISFFNKTNKSADWEKYWGYPDVELAAYAINLGDNQVLGNAYGVMPAIHFKARKSKPIKLRFSIGGGIAYLTKKYDYESNPLNNAIGSHFNNGTRFGVGLDYKNYSLTGNLYHFSNGSSATPNSGINLFLAKLSYRFKVGKNSKSTIEYQKEEFKSKSYKKWGLDLYGVRGFNQFVTPGGPTYGIYAVSLGVYKSISPFIRLHGALEYEYNETLYKFFINDFYTEAEARKIAYNSIFSIGTELFFGNIGFRPKIGIYLPYPTIERGAPFYIKLETHYYPLGPQAKFSPYIGVALKSHYAVAQYISVQSGFNF